MIIDCPEPPLDPPEPEQLNGYWFYGEWFPRDVREWELDADDGWEGGSTCVE